MSVNHGLVISPLRSNGAIMKDIVELLIKAASSAGERNYSILMEAAWAIQDLRNEINDLRQEIYDIRADFNISNDYCNNHHIHKDQL